ncbi:hypothetical protein [Burkholderia cepacia]|uniref:hypothetical protein n=2 Tax=Burkholderia TaxID=32008 RepID=UPI003AF3B859
MLSAGEGISPRKRHARTRACTQAAASPRARTIVGSAFAIMSARLPSSTRRFFSAFLDVLERDRATGRDDPVATISPCATGCTHDAAYTSGDTGSIASRIAIGLRSAGDHSTPSASMKKSISLRVAVIASAVAVYSIYMHIQQLVSGCMWIRGYQRCSFENSTNFQGWMDLDLMITCCWVAAAVVGWISVAQGTKKPG